ncbi:hypothetical protein AB205_0204750, partial [Aquarana catesbeiana]
PLRKAKFVESPRIPESELGSPTLSSSQKLDADAYLLGEEESVLGPPPSVDEAANTLMTRLGFLLGEKVSEVQAASAQYSMEGQEENQGSAATQRISPCSTLTSSTASPPANSPCSTLPPPNTTGATKDCSPTSTLESRDSGIIGKGTNLTISTYDGLRMWESISRVTREDLLINRPDVSEVTKRRNLQNSRYDGESLCLIS